MTKVYNKLVRDRIPEIIESAGKQCSISVLDRSGYLDELDKKLEEEFEEYRESRELEELADMVEVIRAIVIARGSDMTEFEELLNEKRNKRGGFEKMLFLESVTE